MVRSVGVPAERAAAPRHGSRGLALGVLTAVLFLTFLDNTIVSVALGSVQAELHAGVSALQWVVSAYALTFAGAMLAFGMVGDEFGRKRAMLIGVAIFCAGSVMAAVAPNIGLVIAGRAVMGLGAAASEPGTLSMLRHLYTDERTRTGRSASGRGVRPGPRGRPGHRRCARRRLELARDLLVQPGLRAGGPGGRDDRAAGELRPGRAPGGHRRDRAGRRRPDRAGVRGDRGRNTGFTSASVITLLGLSALAAVAFFWWEGRAAHPLLDLKFLRMPTFLTANVVAFCAYFATFAVFFFTALYLEEVVGDTGYQITLAFLPMTALMIAASLLAGRWTDPSGPRWSIFIGCLMFGGGLLLTTVTLSPHPAYLPLAAALALTGVGIGATVVPITSAALSAVPPARSGMAASATNTSREIGAVTGVAILGALVNAQLRSSLTSRLKHLGIPSNFQSIVIHAVETGGVPSNGNASGAGGAAGAGQGALVQEVIHAAYSAFYAGLRAALLLSAFLVLAAGLFTFVLLGRRAAGSDRA